jgi:hypothetical protein
MQEWFFFFFFFLFLGGFWCNKVWQDFINNTKSLLKVLGIISFCTMWGDLQANFFFFGGFDFLIN